LTQGNTASKGKIVHQGPAKLCPKNKKQPQAAHTIKH
jgi:hypothetical protein